jgi:PAS domain S-box-containing protein
MTDEQRVSGGIYRGEDDRTRLERLVAIFEHSTDAIVGKTLDGTITDWNAAAERAYGWRAEEAVGRHIGMIFPPDRQQEMVDILERLRRGEETPPHETERLRKDGSIFPVLVTVSPIRDRTGRVVMGSKTSLDLTDVLRRLAERSRLEGALLAAREFAHLLQNDLTEPVFLVDVLREDEPDLPPSVTQSLAAIAAGLDAAARHVEQFQQVLRVAIKDTPVGPSLDLDRSTRRDSPST